MLRIGSFKRSQMALLHVEASDKTHYFYHDGPHSRLLSIQGRWSAADVMPTKAPLAVDDSNA